MFDLALYRLPREQSLTTLWNAGVFLPVVFWSFSPLQHNNDNVLLLVVAFGLLIKKVGMALPVLFSVVSLVAPQCFHSYYGAE